MHDFARQGTLAGEASLPSDVDTPHSRNGSTPSSMGRLQRIGAAQLWQVEFLCPQQALLQDQIHLLHRILLPSFVYLLLLIAI